MTLRRVVVTYGVFYILITSVCSGLHFIVEVDTISLADVSLRLQAKWLTWEFFRALRVGDCFL